MLKSEGVIFRGGLRMVSIGDAGAVFEDNDNKKVEIPCDTVVLSLGVQADSSYVDQFAECADDVLTIGDCNTKQGTLYHAVHTGHEAGYFI